MFRIAYTQIVDYHGQKRLMYTFSEPTRDETRLLNEAKYLFENGIIAAWRLQRMPIGSQSWLNYEEGQMLTKEQQNLPSISMVLTKISEGV